MRFNSWFRFLGASFFSLALVQCQTPKGNYSAKDVKRVTNPGDCAQLTPDRQALYIEWVRRRAEDGIPTDPHNVAKIANLGQHESGNNAACISGHGCYGQVKNRAGEDGTFLASIGKVWEIVKHPLSHQTNFGALQISPDQVPAYTDHLMKISSFSSDNLTKYCLVDKSYDFSSVSRVKSSLVELSRQRDQIPGWVQTIGNYSLGNRDRQAACIKDPKCAEATNGIGKWLSLCPGFNLDISYAIIDSGKGPNYWGTWRQSPPICEKMIAAEINNARKVESSNSRGGYIVEGASSSHKIEDRSG